jgi:SAM-dependent methyltransferase
MIQELNCPICSGKVHRKAQSIAGYRRGQVFDILECGNCGVSYADPMESESRLYEAIYSNVSSVPGYARYFELAQEIGRASDPLAHIAAAEDCYFGVVKHIRDTLRPGGGLIAEIGCGQGYLTYALNRAGYRAIGVDISETVISLARKRFGDHYFHGELADLVRSPQNRPALMVCTELIEHLTDPIGFMQMALEHLEPGGELLITTPHKRAGEVGVWDTDLPPVHLWWFTRESLVAASRRLGADIRFIDLGAFYRDQPGERVRADQPKTLRPSFFDESYTLIAPIRKRNAFRSKLRKVEKGLKDMIYSLVGRRSSAGREPCNDGNSSSICAVLIKR